MAFGLRWLLDKAKTKTRTWTCIFPVNDSGSGGGVYVRYIGNWRPWRSYYARSCRREISWWNDGWITETALVRWCSYFAWFCSTLGLGRGLFLQRGFNFNKSPVTYFFFQISALFYYASLRFKEWAKPLCRPHRAAPSQKYNLTIIHSRPILLCSYNLPCIEVSLFRNKGGGTPYGIRASPSTSAVGEVKHSRDRFNLLIF